MTYPGLDAHTQHAPSSQANKWRIQQYDDSFLNNSFVVENGDFKYWLHARPQNICSMN